MKINFNNPAVERPHNICGEGGEGTQKIWRFDNGFGASVVRFSLSRLFDGEKLGSYGVDAGLWELAVVKWESKEDDILDFEITYETKITSDVVGHLSEDEVVCLLNEIRELK